MMRVLKIMQRKRDLGEAFSLEVGELRGVAGMVVPVIWLNGLIWTR